MHKYGQWSTDSEMHTTRHELGHGVIENIERTNYETYELKMAKIESIMNKHIANMPDDIKEKNKYMKDMLSIYGFDTVHEFVAESIAEYTNGKEKCRPLALEVVSIIKE